MANAEKFHTEIYEHNLLACAIYLLTNRNSRTHDSSEAAARIEVRT